MGQQVAQKLERLGIRSVQDLLLHLPFRYEDRTRISAIGSVRPGSRVAIVGQIEHTEVAFGRRRSLLSRISDVLSIQARTVGRVEVSEKPELTWDRPDLDRLYERLGYNRLPGEQKRADASNSVEYLYSKTLKQETT